MSPARRFQKVAVINFCMDAAAVLVSFYVAYLLRFVTGIIETRHHPPLWVYARTLIIVLPVYLGMLRAYGLYDTSRHIRRIEEIFLVIKAVTFAVLVLTALTFFYRDYSYSRLFLVILWAASIFFVSMSRYFIIQIEYARKEQKKDVARVLLIGATKNARNLIQWSKNFPHYGQEIIAVLARDESLIGKHVEGVPIAGLSEEAERYLSELNPDQVILLDPSFPRDRITDLVVVCEDEGIEFKVAADMYGLMTRNVTVENISSVPLLGFRSLPLDDFWNRSVKRLFDIVVAFTILILSLPVSILLCLAIKLDDGGPVLYKQERVGRDHKVFKLLKFRTMKVDAERETGPVWAKEEDSRRTRTGDFLRKWNLDELPQLVNVLRGDMSMVGPRPERPHFVGKFREKIPRYMARHKIKSGLTGWAQVHGYRGNTSIAERTKYDIYYMENWSLLMDIEIILMTFFAFKNAY